MPNPDIINLDDLIRPLLPDIKDMQVTYGKSERSEVITAYSSKDKVISFMRFLGSCFITTNLYDGDGFKSINLHDPSSITEIKKAITDNLSIKELDNGTKD